MKLLLGLIVIIFSFFTMNKELSQPKAQNYSEFVKEWSAVDSLMAKGLIEDALIQVESIHQLALQQKNHPQIYKTLIYIEKLSSSKDELFLAGIIQRLESKLVQLDPVSKSMIQSMLGSLYLNMQSNRYYNGKRSEIKGDEQDTLEIQTWSAEKLVAKANQHILESLKNPASKTELTTDYQAIILNSEHLDLCPSLYELLLWRAIEHFSNLQAALTDFGSYVTVQYQFSPVDEFLKYDKIDNSALMLYQEWLKHLKNTGNEKAFVIANLKRLQYEFQIFNNLNSSFRYYKALESYYQENKKSKYSSFILTDLVKYLLSSSETNLVQNRNNFQILDSLCDQGLTTVKDTQCLQLLKNAKDFIRIKSLQIEQEKVIPSKEYSKIKLSYSNVSSLYFKLYKVPLTGLKDLQIPYLELAKPNLAQYKLVKSWKAEWKSIDDFKQHSVELKIDPLELGRYYIVASTHEDLNKSDVQNGGFFLVSNVATFQITEAGKPSEIVVVDRKKGSPISKAKVYFFTQKRERYDVPAKLILQDTKLTDKNGKVKIATNEYLQYYVALGKDIYSDESGIAQSYDYRESENYDYSFFLDRSIYRPGQTVYFKAFAITHYPSGKYPTILANKSFRVTLRNANYQEVGSLDLKTNEYGTAHGSFILPKNGLNGYFQLETSHGSHGFQVEEYKRPNFEIKFDTLKKSYAIDDLVQVSGKVISYNGIPLETKIKYTIGRQNFFPWFDFRGVGKFRFNSSDQIDHGVIESNDKGEFTIQFKAEGSKELQWKESIQEFEINVDATDENQETQSNSYHLKLSYKKFFIQCDLKRYVESMKDSFKVIVQNINGNTIASSINLKVYSLESPNRFLRKRLWNVPDIQIYSLSEFKKYFPNDVYADEDDIKNWKTLRVVSEMSLPTSTKFHIDLSKLILREGFYKFQLEVKDVNGNIDTFNTFTNAYVSNSKFNSSYPDISFPKISGEPGETIRFSPLAIQQDYYFYYRINSKTANINSWNKVDRMGSIEYLIKEEDRGGMAFSGICIFENRIFEYNHSVTIPWSNKFLQIESSSFRNKLYPGQDEEWTFKISDSKNTKEKYEVLASMYDQSLDQILQHQWNFDVRPGHYSNFSFQQNAVSIFTWNPIVGNSSDYSYLNFDLKFPELNEYDLFGSHFLSDDIGRPVLMDAVGSRSGGTSPSEDSKPRIQSKGKMEKAAVNEKNEDKTKPISSEQNTTNSSDLQIRKNLQETVFFYPQLYTDEKGLVKLKFTMNEAMTKWKLQIFAHSLDLKYGSAIEEVITRKPLQIKPYYPRFFRQGDQIQLSAMISNQSEEIQDGIATLQILDANSLKDISSEFNLKSQSKNFHLAQSKNINLQWNFEVRADEIRTFLIRYIAKGTNHSDGEEMLIPVVSNRKLITETHPLPIKGKQTKTFTFESLKKLNSNGSQAQQFTLEFSSHPVWYALQVLPHMMEYPHECSEQLMAKIYANAIGTEIMKKYPKVANTLKEMLRQGHSVSKLLQNQELKSALLEETPWVLDAQSESEQMKRVALLMDFNNMENELKSSIYKLQQRQNSDGSFSWFPGLYPDRYMTQHIVVQISHLKRLKINLTTLKELGEIAQKARSFLDYSVQKEYNDLAAEVQLKKRSWEDNNLTSTLIHYYYCKSLFEDWIPDSKMKPIDNYYLGQIENHWMKYSLYEQGLSAIIAHHNSKKDLAQLILKSLKQRSLYSEELGRYWKNPWSYYWTQMPVETQAIMIELFSEVAKNPNTVDELKTWLLKNKQTQYWGSTKATSEAIFAILAFGDNYTEENQVVSIDLGNQKLDLSSSAYGTTYYKNSWTKSDIKPEFASIKISNPNKSIAWGAAYYQYFQDMDKVDQSNMKELVLKKELYLRSNTKTGNQLIPLTNLSKVKTGDIVTARLILKADRSMDYVHLKVMRAAGLEPLRQISGYEYSSGLGYYLSPRDLATDFFIAYLPKGTYVLEYDMRASFKGEFSDGISSLQSMYAPEFAAHSKGIRILID